MSKPQTEHANTGDTIDLGIIALPVDELVTLPAEGFARTGVILANAREKRILMVPMSDGTHRPVTCTVSLYVQRDAIDDHEAEQVAAVKSERDAKAAERDAKEQATIKAEKRAMFELGQQSTLSNMRNVTDMVQSARALAALDKLVK